MIMDKKEGYVEFLNSESYKTHLELWYKVHNISREKTELYYDFLISLFDLIDSTYLGDDVIQTEEDMLNHFSWCFNQIVLNFEKERIYFKNRGNHFEFLKLFFFGAYYSNRNQNAPVVIKEYIGLLF